MKITTEYLINNRPETRNPMIVSFGGGVNSTAMLIGFSHRGIRPDLILFANTGGELPETYAHIEQLDAWLTARQLPAITWVQKTYAGQPTTLEADCLRNKTLPSIAFGFKSCSVKYKREPQDKFCNHWPPAQGTWERGQKCIKAIGYDTGEQRRAVVMDDDKYIYWYPLIEWGWWREECVAICCSEGFSPPKSACFFCPNSKKVEVLSLKHWYPDLLRRALIMERNGGLLRSGGWVYRVSSRRCHPRRRQLTLVREHVGNGVEVLLM
jgi:hypothetical protein